MVVPVGYKVRCYWKFPRISPLALTKENTPFHVLRVNKVDDMAVGDELTIPLVRRASVGQTPPWLLRDVRILDIKTSSDVLDVVVEPINQKGLTYQELCALINVEMLGRHPEFGWVKGKLLGIDPDAETVGIACDDCRPIMELITSSLEDEVECVDFDEDCVVHVDWYTLYVAAYPVPIDKNIKEQAKSFYDSSSLRDYWCQGYVDGENLEQMLYSETVSKRYGVSGFEAYTKGYLLGEVENKLDCLLIMNVIRTHDRDLFTNYQESKNLECISLSMIRDKSNFSVRTIKKCLKYLIERNLIWSVDQDKYCTNELYYMIFRNNFVPDDQIPRLLDNLFQFSSIGVSLID